jgi:hypothetical protein
LDVLLADVGLSAVCGDTSHPYAEFLNILEIIGKTDSGYQEARDCGVAGLLASLGD